MTEQRWLTLILIGFAVLASAYALVTPPFEASDELWHYPMVRHLADGNPLPVQVYDPAQAGPWKQEASQPPLYYYAGAALTFWIDTADMADVRIENPHVDNGIITADGNTNLVMHPPQQDPWQGTLLSLRLVRFMSVIMSTVTVYLTYRIAGAALPGRPEVALGAAAVNAFLPMFLFISGAVNNDNLAIMLASLALWIMIGLVASASGHTSNRQHSGWPRWLLLGIVIALALLTKEGTLGLLPLAWGTAFIAAWQGRRVEPQPENLSQTVGRLLRAVGRSLLTFAIIMVPVALIAGWWYWRNVQLYGDLLGWSAFIAVLGERAHPASLLQLWGERRGFMMAYWGLFGGVNIPMPDWIYRVFNSLLLLAIVGFVIYVGRELLIWLRTVQGAWRNLYGIIDNVLQLVSERFALVICVLFSAAVVFGLVRWATTTWSSQGRLVFTAISALSTLLAIGLVGWLPPRFARPIMGLIALFFLGTAVAAPFFWIAPAYAAENYNLADEAQFERSDVTFSDKLRLHQVAVEPDAAALQPGDSFWVHLEWETLAPMERDWSFFVHAVDPVIGRPIAQRDMYPGQGLYLTSWLANGTRRVDSMQLTIPPTAVAPANLEIVAGLYDARSGERLLTAAGADSVSLGALSLQAAPGEAPNATLVNFEDQLELSGYAIEPRSLQPGDELDLTLYWRALRPLDKDYTFFAQVVDEDTTRWASVDLRPTPGTTQWAPDESQELSLSLEVAADTPADVYPLIIGVYTQNESGEFERLQIRTADGRLTEDFLTLTQIRVEP